MDILTWKDILWWVMPEAGHIVQPMVQQTASKEKQAPDYQ
jgi:hypothetical protein